MRYPGWILLGAVVVTSPGLAADALGLYTGAGAGQAEIRADPGPGGVGTGLGFIQRDTGWTASLGIRPMPHFGVEAQYFDFGHPSATISVFRMEAEARGAALSAVGYLPLAGSRFDLYAKAGFGALHVAASRRALVPVACPRMVPGCPHGSAEATNIRPTWGAGALLRMTSSLAARAEYARFSAPTGDADLLSLSLIWAF